LIGAIIEIIKVIPPGISDIQQATVKAYNNSGTAITAKIDIRIKGY